MEREKIKYFLEHKTERFWVSLHVWDEVKTNDPLRAKSFEYKPEAEAYLSEIKPKYQSNFSGDTLRQYNKTQILFQRITREGLLKLGYDLFTDFEVTEHEFAGN